MLPELVVNLIIDHCTGLTSLDQMLINISEYYRNLNYSDNDINFLISALKIIERKGELLGMTMPN